MERVDIVTPCLVVNLFIKHHHYNHHRRYTPKLDEFRNKFLETGMCSICKVPNIKILKLNCNHGICIEDLRGYLESALGDISQFPVKCPMHYEGCPGIYSNS